MVPKVVPEGVPNTPPNTGGSHPQAPREPIGCFRRSEVVPTPGTTGSHPASSERGGGGSPPIRGNHPPDAPHGTTYRALKGRHQPSCKQPHTNTCPGCEPCPQPHCDTCGREHAEHTCPRCVGRARDNLTQLLTLTHQLPTHATQGRHAYHLHADDIPGGDATVLLTPASTHHPHTNPTHNHTNDKDPTPPLDVLTHWCQQWGAYQPHTTTHTDQLTDAARYLADQLHHIAQHHTFPELAHHLANTVTTLENVLHAGHRPDVSRVPCLDCGAHLHKVWTDHPDHDHWRCPVCGQTYDHGRYERAKHDHLASQGAERYVPLTDAIAAVGRPGHTVRNWINDGTVTARRTTTGRVEVWWPHVRERHLTTPTRRRRTNDPQEPTP